MIVDLSESVFAEENVGRMGELREGLRSPVKVSGRVMMVVMMLLLLDVRWLMLRWLLLLLLRRRWRYGFLIGGG